MYRDVVELRAFYASPLGRIAQRMIRQRLVALWPDVRGRVMLGLGYAPPFLRPFMDDADRVMAVMPAGQGAIRWPQTGPRLVALADDSDLPFQDMSIDLILLAHALESSPAPAALLQECWRLLNGCGRLIAVVPNRQGVWARSEGSPFAHGQPFTSGQLTRLLQNHRFIVERVERAIYLPPVPWRFLQRTAPACEKFGRRWIPGFAGVVMVEASKQLHAPQQPRRALSRDAAKVPGGALAAG